MSVSVVGGVLSRCRNAWTGHERSTARFVYADLPSAGLGNKMLVWARAVAFAHRNPMPLFVTGWGQIKVGPLLRRERSARFYFGYFDDPCAVDPLGRLILRRAERQQVDPEVAAIPPPAKGDPITAYVFRGVPHWSDSFAGIREDHGHVRAAFHAIVTPEHRRELSRRPAPVVGVHVRLGDFRALRPGEDFAKVGHVRAPLSYFRSRIEGIRRVCGGSVPVTLFSDGRDSDLAELLALPNVQRSTGPSDLVDLLLLARSRVIVVAPGSSFGQWAGSLADAPVLHHPAHFHAPSRPPELNERWYEGPAGESAESWPKLLLENLRGIREVVGW
jgi:hypothetical protein